ncbi:hypothetical protein IW139_000839 [Coemansia sp. RSA 353]|nr:hypothetical protein GGH15_001669 [Coemansia sp. RSA 562]KAJ2176059.1 hypothetical protein GGH16_000354 [Coemansia sp. RSA 560]KAJ2190693.1 hypothetical protein EV181_000860 [Coemansia sp. RSA 532]KAJ2199200.1 hypothetical protein GGH18_000650 [Coemansia sp. RSA 530]KAJ2200423.1 hypothetical protein IW144_001130 [Coemansia sp. RSA 522]KAJ2208413.1 hypothetical protein IW145_000759 [Coemansia sp. RSA 521]KAJ2246687.1 hypothetical protein GGH97_002387 [Coemansia sp. RSA 475]KAJ2283392.1 hyp
MRGLKAVVAVAAAMAVVEANGVIGDPLAIIIKLPSMNIPVPSHESVEVTSSARKPAIASSSSVYVTPTPSSSSSVYVTPTPSSSAYVTPPPEPTTSSSSYVAPPPASSSSVYSDEPQATQAPQGDIPDGQGNTFTVPPGAVKFPWNYNNADNVVPLTPGSQNGGWAMSPNQMCKPNSWCPYACAPGYYSAQWDPSAVLYNGAGSMNGGLYADANGVLSKPNKDAAFCVRGMGNARIRNTLGESVSACQTVYPGNEAMIIPSVAGAGGSVDLNIVPSTYWLGTSSQFYVNLRGSSAEQCVWGDSDKPVGNWAPYIFGGGQAKDGNTYISVQFNPLYTSAGFSVSDAYNVEIVCDGGACNFPEGGKCKCEGGKCSVDNGCTVTLGAGASASFVLY